MKPYYEDEWATIYHADCREVLPSLTADVVLTDLPYGVGGCCVGIRRTPRAVPAGGGSTCGSQSSFTALIRSSRVAEDGGTISSARRLRTVATRTIIPAQSLWSHGAPSLTASRLTNRT